MYKVGDRVRYDGKYYGIIHGTITIIDNKDNVHRLIGTDSDNRPIGIWVSAKELIFDKQWYREERLKRLLS